MLWESFKSLRVHSSKLDIPVKVITDVNALPLTFKLNPQKSTLTGKAPTQNYSRTKVFKQPTLWNMQIGLLKSEKGSKRQFSI